jgi:protein TonB
MRATVSLLIATVIAAAASSSPVSAQQRGSRVEPPVLVHKSEPQYTLAARKAQIQGAVRLYVEIGTDGRAHRLRVTKGLGYGLDAEAVQAVRQWRFLPGTRDGVAVKTPAVIEVNFRLPDDARPADHV